MTDSSGIGNAWETFRSATSRIATTTSQTVGRSYRHQQQQQQEQQHHHYSNAILPLARITSSDSEEQVMDYKPMTTTMTPPTASPTTTTTTSQPQKTTNTWRSFLSFPNLVVQGQDSNSPLQREDEEEEEQSRDYEKTGLLAPSTPTTTRIDQYDDTQVTERVDVPSSPTSPKTAQMSPSSRSLSSKAMTMERPQQEKQQQQQKQQLEHSINLHGLMASATEDWIHSQIPPSPRSPHSQPSPSRKAQPTRKPHLRPSHLHSTTRRVREQRRHDLRSQNRQTVFSNVTDSPPTSTDTYVPTTATTTTTPSSPRETKRPNPSSTTQSFEQYSDSRSHVSKAMESNPTSTTASTPMMTTMTMTTTIAPREAKCSKTSSAQSIEQDYLPPSHMSDHGTSNELKVLSKTGRTPRKEDTTSGDAPLSTNESKDTPSSLQPSVTRTTAYSRPHSHFDKVAATEKIMRKIMQRRMVSNTHETSEVVLPALSHSNPMTKTPEPTTPPPPQSPTTIISLTMGLEPEEILSVEPEHGNHCWIPPVSEPRDPPASNSSVGSNLSVTSVDRTTPSPLRKCNDAPRESLTTQQNSKELLTEGQQSNEVDKDDDDDDQDSTNPTTSSSERPKDNEYKATIDVLRSLPILSPRNPVEDTTSAILPTTAPSTPAPMVQVSPLKSITKKPHVRWNSPVKPAVDHDPLKDLDRVFLRDDTYVWVPARVLNRRLEYAVCAIDLPFLWTHMTVVVPPLTEQDAQRRKKIHPSMKDFSIEDQDRFVAEFHVDLTDLRIVRYTDYENGELPSAVREQSKGIRNMADLEHLHLPGILENLKARHFQQTPYTRMGDIIIAMNPFAWIPQLYESNVRDSYSHTFVWKEKTTSPSGEDDERELTGCDQREMEPHVYEVSSMAYRSVATTGQDQTILVTGESGAGKTETVKIIMHHLATVQRSRPGGVPLEHSTAKEILTRVLQSIPVFEAFGNAHTSQNANSSRLGKLTQFQFQVEPQSVASIVGRDVPFADLVGSSCKTCLLEKSRVVSRNPNERSFHIFYQLLSSSTEFKRSVWPPLAHRTARRYTYTDGEVGNVEEDAAAWEDTLAALKVFRYDEDSLKTLFQALVIVLQLGNLIFESDPKDTHHDSAVVKNGNDLSELAELMRIRRLDLLESLTSRALRTPGEDAIRVTMASQNAKECCDSLAKEIYSKVFDSVVLKVNNYTAYPEPLLDGKVKCAHIFLLDIFGFERFDVNRFEQLCIKYANERLHQKYVSDNFNEVKDEYEAEGVDLNDFQLINNSSTIALLEGHGGILSALNDECSLPKGSAEAFVSRLKNSHKGSGTLIDDRLDRKWQFGIDHLTGPVSYDAQNFINRNMDRLPESLVECAAKSGNPLIADAFQSLLTDRALESARKLKSRSEPRRLLLQQFQGQLKDLMLTIAGTKTHYIRCIKPNQDMTPRKTDHKTTLEQLECSGIATTLAISRKRFPHKLSYDFVIQRYGILMSKAVLPGSDSTAIRVKSMLHDKLGVPFMGHERDLPFVCGNTSVFLKAGARDILEFLRGETLSSAAILIQKVLRGHMAHRRVTDMKYQVSIVQSFCRMVIVLLRLRRQTEAATKIATFERRSQAIRKVQMMKDEVAARMAREEEAHEQAKRAMSEPDSVSERMTSTVVRRTKDVPTLTADLWAITQQAIMECGVASRGAIAKNPGQSSQTPQKFISEFHEMYGHLWMEISALRKENEELRFNLSTSEATTASLKTDLENTSAASASKTSEIERLVRHNESLVDELHSARLESARLTNSLRTKQTDLETLLATAEKDLADSKREHAQRISDSQREIKSAEIRSQETQRRHEEEIASRDQKHAELKKKMDGEYQLAQDSHEKQLARLVDMIGNGHSKHQDEVVKVTAELLAVRKEKDEEIMILQHEINALKARKKGSPRSIRVALDPRYQESQIQKQSTLRSKRALEFDTLFKSLHGLVTEICVLPNDISDKEMGVAIEQQKLGQKMFRLLESLGDMYQKEEESNQKTCDEALSLMEEYVSVTEPNRTILHLNDLLKQTELQVSRLEEELKEKAYCKRCAIRDSTAERRRRISGGTHWG